MILSFHVVHSSYNGNPIGTNPGGHLPLSAPKKTQQPEEEEEEEEEEDDDDEGRGGRNTRNNGNMRTSH